MNKDDLLRILKRFTDIAGSFFKYNFIPFINRITAKVIYFIRNIKDKFKSFIIKCELNIKCRKIYHYIKENILYTFVEFYNDVLKKKKFKIYFVLSVSVLILWSGIYRIFFERNVWEGENLKKITIIRGMNVDEISGMLRDSNVVSSSLIFKVSAKLSGKSSKIYSGVYYLPKGLNNMEIIDILTAVDYARLGGRGKITVYEGMRIKQIASLLRKDFEMDEDEFIRASENDSLINILGLKGEIKNLEGFLFPETYIVPVSAGARDIVFILFDEFLKRVFKNPELNGSFKKSPFKLLSLVTLASIVQAETGIISEMPIIAGVYYNRLERNMKLQADPTIQYILPEGPRRLLNRDYKIESDYNTYIHEGLPPGPINNPGLDAITACLNPEKHEYFYFVANRDRSHKFSKSYEEHQQAIKKIREK
ncbi:MAG: endolytic transglycosylase MltG [Ignavibacteria bacterium]|nr:endolytic transglycosylase MltG [Ignavibacteria bacterium]